ncbi:hypothetical protein [Amycolatopsis sp. cmx-4-61]
MEFAAIADQAGSDDGFSVESIRRGLDMSRLAQAAPSVTRLKYHHSAGR